MKVPKESCDDSRQPDVCQSVPMFMRGEAYHKIIKNPGISHICDPANKDL